LRNQRKLGALEQRLILLCAILLVAFAALFMKLPSHIAAMEERREYEEDFYEFSQLFAEIYAEVKRNYVDEVDNEKLFNGAIRGMYSTLDPHSQWLPPRDLSQLEKTTEGEFSGIGAHITLDVKMSNILTVIAPMPGSPAVRAGIRALDRIVEIEGESTEGITLTEAVERLTGPTGSQVSFKVLREGEPELKEFTITREKIKIENVFHQVLEGDVGYIRIANFAEDTASDVKKALQDFNSNVKVKALIVDLRYNTGGLLDKVVEICDYFLPRDQLIVSTRGRRTESNQRHVALQPKLTELPLVVLVNSVSASASEIFAGAMQDTERGFVIGPEGQKTFGKGSVQTISMLNNTFTRNASGEKLRSGHRLTTAKYYTPSGRTIHEVGVTPDEYVTALKPEQERELLVHGLLGEPDQTALFTPPPTVGEGEKPTEPVEFRDVQLEETVKFVRTMLAIQRRISKG
jgi:carboxyl-terminal processing protease